MRINGPRAVRELKTQRSESKAGLLTTMRGHASAVSGRQTILRAEDSDINPEHMILLPLFRIIREGTIYCHLYLIFPSVVYISLFFFQPQTMFRCISTFLTSCFIQNLSDALLLQASLVASWGRVAYHTLGGGKE